MPDIVLYCIVLCCIVLYCIVLYCIVLYCIVLYCIVLYCIVLCYVVLYCIVLHLELIWLVGWLSKLFVLLQADPPSPPPPHSHPPNPITQCLSRQKVASKGRGKHMRMQRQTSQTTTFRLRTGQRGLRAHLKRIGIMPHILQDCPIWRQQRHQIWPQDESTTNKLWGTAEDLRRTTQFLATCGLRV